MAPDIKENVSLQSYNTFGIEVLARYFVEITSEEALISLFKEDIVTTHPVLVIGGGSNMLFTTNFNGLVVKMSIEGIGFTTDGDAVAVTAGGGVVWHSLVTYCVQNGFAGLENLSLIPGTVGASPVQNIGAYGVELMDVFHSCRAFNRRTGQLEVFSNAACKFAYRDSIFKHDYKDQYIITSVTFRLSKVPNLRTSYGAITEELSKRGIAHPTIADISNVVAHIRVGKLPDPATIGNAGSFFKNPIISPELFEAVLNKFPTVVHYPAEAGNYKIAAGWLIEQCGLKGIVAGNTGTWKNQALVLVNHGGATGAEVYSFSEQIINEVYKKFNIRLEREVNIF